MEQIARTIPCQGANARLARSIVAGDAADTLVMNASTSAPVIGEMSICVLTASAANAGRSGSR
jgi:hypothetical protein